MELVLNLAWLLLALPAYWLWRDCRSVPVARRFTALQCLLTLGCTLVILFPVVSATDDLRAMRAEMEESPASKRSIGQSSGERPATSKSLVQPALALTSESFLLADRGWLRITAPDISSPVAPVVLRAGRSPPCSVPA